jgi:CheY-like chemotaxis protein/Tfp pilus assembly protein PilF
MRLIYPDVGECRALVVDSNPTSRSILAGMLRDMGVGEVVQSSRVLDARRTLEARVFDIVLCDYHFDNSPMSGQDLLDDLRRANLLPYSTVFVMVTGEASYARVAEAAEAALDSYLIKPHTATTLEKRLVQARHRKQVLRSIFAAIEANDFATAAQLCESRFQQRAEYWLYAARIGAELYLRQGNRTAARKLYEAVKASKALPWARLGIARVELEGGQINEACGTLHSLIDDEPGFADAYDVMGRAQVELGQLDEALATYRTACELTPHSVVRLQKQGMLAFYLGVPAESSQALERAMRIGISSKMFDPQSLLLLAFMHFEQRDTKAVGRVLDNLRLAAERQPDSLRLQRLLGTTTALHAAARNDAASCVQGAKALAAQIRAEDFDFEAASNLLALLTRLHPTGMAPAESADWVHAIAQRFCVSKATADLLCLTVRGHPQHEAAIRDGHAGIGSLAEQAMTHSVGGAPAAAVQALVTTGAATLNAKLIEMAGAVLQRHSAKIGDSAALELTIDDLKRRYCTRGAQVALGMRSGRSAGGLSLRN